MNPRVVLFFTRDGSLKGWDEGGMFGREVALYTRLFERSFPVTFVSYGRHDDLRFAAHIPDIDVVCNRWGLPSRVYTRLIERGYPFLWGRNAIFKSNQMKGAEIALSAARRFDRPFVARCGYLHSEFCELEHGVDSPQARKARDLETLVFRGATAISVTTKEMARRVQDDYAIEPARITVIPNYVDADRFRPMPTRELRGRATARRPRLIFVGRLVRQKNVQALFEAIEGMDVDLVVVGSGVADDQLRATAEARRLRVTFLQNVPNTQLPDLFADADLFVLPSLYEGQPKALLEAMSCGMPVIGADAAGIRGVIDHGVNGWLSGSTPEELRASIEHVLGDSPLRMRLGRGAREYILRHHALDRVIEAETAMLADACLRHEQAARS